MTVPARIPPALWPEVSALFDEAMALPAAEREPWLCALDGSRSAVAQHLRQMLGALATADTLRPPGGEWLAAALAAQAHTLAAGQRIGIYKLVQPIGQGGMAAVWAADQQQGVLRRVALKLPHAGVEAPAAMAQRFEQERDLLAGLEHPHIARLYDAGVAAVAGAHEYSQPYLAMELIDGQTITSHCQALPLRRRLVLFLQVLAAVSFAHGRLVIHRDIKPVNILVTPQGQVKLLDFGIARLLGDASVEGQPGQQTGVLPGRAFTPDGASPEQLAGGALGAVADVYSLGVVLYELLASRRPYALDRQSATPLVQQLQAAVIEPPSAAAPALRRQLAGDLDAIVARAMALNPAQRYASADALAADIRNHLDRLPVQARGTSRRYRAGRLMRRHWLALSAGTGVVGALAIGLGVALWQAQMARGQAQRAQAVQRFIVGVFNASHPQQAQGQPVSARALLDQGARRLDAELKDQPEVSAELHLEIGGIYNALGDNVQARTHIEQALALYATLGQLDTERAIEAQYQQLELLKEEQQFDAARAAGQRVLQRAGRAFGPRHPWWLGVQDNLAWLASQQGDAAGAERLLVRALAEAPPGSDPVQLLRLRASLGSVQMDMGQPAAARDSYAAVVAGAASVPQHDTTDRLVDRYNLARARYNLGEFAVAADELARLVPEMDRHIGPRHDRTLKARGLWAQAELERGAYAKAVDIQRANLAQALARDTVDEDVASVQRLTLAKVLRLAGRYAEGLPIAQQGLAFMDTKYREPTWFRVRGRWIMGELLTGLGRRAEGLAALEQAAQLGTGLAGHEDNPAYADILQAQALALALRAGPGDAPAAATLIDRAQAAYIKKLGFDSAAARRAGVHGAWLALLAQPVDVAAARAFEAAAAEWAKTSPLAAGELALMRAEAFARAGRNAQARAEHELGAAVWQQVLGVPWSGHFIGLH